MKLKTTTKILLPVSFILLGCSTTNSYIETPDTPLEWNDKFDSEDWRKKFDRCRPFLYMDDDSWHWWMEKMV